MACRSCHRVGTVQQVKVVIKVHELERHFRCAACSYEWIESDESDHPPQNDSSE